MSLNPAITYQVPRFSKGYRLHFDKTRHQWFVQAPERAYQTNDIAVAILKHIDGRQTLEKIIDKLIGQFNAPSDRIKHDTLALIEILVEKGILQYGPRDDHTPADESSC